MPLEEGIPRTGDRNLMTMTLADEQMIFFVRGAKTFALGGTQFLKKLILAELAEQESKI